MISSRIIRGIGVVCVLVGLLAWSGAAIPFEIGEGKNRHFSFVTGDDLVATTSGTFEGIPDMTVDFKNKKKGPVLIRFCATCNNGGIGSMQVKAQVNGIDVPFGPGDGIQFAASQTTLPRCFTWVVSHLDRDDYTIGMVWRKFGGGSAFMLSRSLIVEGD